MATTTKSKVEATPPVKTERRIDAPSREQLIREQIQSDALIWLDRMVRETRVLSQNIDDTTRELGGIELYERRMMRDPDVHSSVDLRTLSAIARRLSVRPPVSRKHKRYEEGTKYVAFCLANLARLPGPFKRTLKALHRGIVTGHKIAELVWEYATLDPAVGPQLCLKKIKVKPQRSYRLMGNDFDDVVGVWPMSAGPLPFGTLSEEQRSKILDTSKFAMFINDPEIEDASPAGTSVLRPAYHPWFMNQQQWVGYLGFLAQFASPSAVYEDAPLGWIPPIKNKQTGERYEPLEWGLEMAKSYRNSSAIAVPNGGKLHPQEVKSEGGTFTTAIKLFGTQKVKAITNQTKATEQADNHSRADGQIGQDQMEVTTQYDRSMLAWVIEQLFGQMLVHNYGEEALTLVPVADLGQFATHDFAVVGQTIAQLTGQSYLDLESQAEELDAMMGLPIRDPDRDPGKPGIQQEQQPQEQPAQKQEPQEAAMLIAKALLDLVGSTRA